MKVFLGSAVALLLCLNHAVQGPTIPGPDLLADDFAVYAVVLQTEFVRSDTERIIIGDRTLMALPPVMMGMTRPGLTPELQKMRDAATKDTVQDYEEKNKTSVRLAPKFSLKVPVVLMSEEESERIFQLEKEGKKSGNPKGFEEFYRRYPHSPGFLTLSRVGFNAEKTQAILYVGHLCGGLCGSGQFFLLAKEGE